MSGAQDSEGSFDELPPAQPVGKVLRVSTGKRRQREAHYASFEFDGETYHLEDSVLVVPDEDIKKPYISIIKDITSTKGKVSFTGRKLYRPEETERGGGGFWEAVDAREVFYSFDLSTFPAEHVMHKCVIHFLRSNKKLPDRKEHPGFIVQRVYDKSKKMVRKLTDQCIEMAEQVKIDFLIRNTQERIGELPDLEPDLSGQVGLQNVPQSDGFSSSKCHAILSSFNVLTGDADRDKWLCKLLEEILLGTNSVSADDKNCGSVPHSAVTHFMIPEEQHLSDVAVPTIVSLEKSVHMVLGNEFQKYNQKMRQLKYNIKINPLLRSRLLKRELDPAVVMKMSPDELKAGLTAAEIALAAPAGEERRNIRMTSVRCSRCSAKQVGITGIIHAPRVDRYELECLECGHSWFATRDAFLSMSAEETPDAEDERKNVPPPQDRA